MTARARPQPARLTSTISLILPGCRRAVASPGSPRRARMPLERRRALTQINPRAAGISLAPPPGAKSGRRRQGVFAPWRETGDRQDGVPDPQTQLRRPPGAGGLRSGRALSAGRGCPSRPAGPAAVRLALPRQPPVRGDPAHRPADRGSSCLRVPTLAVVNRADEIAPAGSVLPFLAAMPGQDVRMLEAPKRSASGCSTRRSWSAAKRSPGSGRRSCPGSRPGPEGGSRARRRSALSRPAAPRSPGTSVARRRAR
jgi:hypothetical protein